VKTCLLILGVSLGILVQHEASAQNPVDAPTFDWSGRVGTGGTLRLAAVDGDIAVATSADDQVHLHAERTHVRSGGRALVFAVVQNGDDVAICAYHRHGRCDMSGAHGGSGFTVGRTGAAKLTVQVPATLTLAIRTDDGRVDVRGVATGVTAESGDGSILIADASGSVKARSGDGDVQIQNAGGPVAAETGNGHIAIEAASGPIDAHSSDGSIEVRLAANATSQDMTLRTGDGSVTVYLPTQYAGALDASTGDGSVETELPLEITGRTNPRHLQGTFGSGGSSRLTISTNDGDIRLRKQ
jgi:DUF4097 and DUF4098 domain-containing protein YvlB